MYVSLVVRKPLIRKYDYENKKDNMKHYNQARPLIYDRSPMSRHVPLFLGDVFDDTSCGC
jgi:lysosomal acid lipase/cholesteryl ester hydrolase